MQDTSSSGVDYFSFCLQGGYAVYQFDVGAGVMTLTSDQPLALGEWHTVKFSRDEKTGKRHLGSGLSLLLFLQCTDIVWILE